jgi:hypothetical protein
VPRRCVHIYTMQKPKWTPPRHCNPTALSADDAKKLAEWLEPHVRAIEQLRSRLKEKLPDERDEIRHEIGWADHHLRELLYAARKASGIVERHFMDRPLQ